MEGLGRCSALHTASIGPTVTLNSLQVTNLNSGLVVLIPAPSSPWTNCCWGCAVGPRALLCSGCPGIGRLVWGGRQWSAGLSPAARLWVSLLGLREWPHAVRRLRLSGCSPSALSTGMPVHYISDCNFRSHSPARGPNRFSEGTYKVKSILSVQDSLISGVLLIAQAAQPLSWSHSREATSLRLPRASACWCLLVPIFFFKLM